VLSLHQSDYKTAIIDSLRKDYHVEKLSLKQARNMPKPQKNIVLVLDQNKATLHLNGALKKVLKTLDPQKTIYYITSGDPDWKWKQTGITSITSASQPQKLSAILKRIRADINGM
jgi:lipid A disaccharide synthetase